jgi:hypothetical protein
MSLPRQQGSVDAVRAGQAMALVNGERRNAPGGASTRPRWPGDFGDEGAVASHPGDLPSRQLAGLLLPADDGRELSARRWFLHRCSHELLNRLPDRTGGHC